MIAAGGADERGMGLTDIHTQNHTNTRTKIYSHLGKYSNARKYLNARKYSYARKHTQMHADT